MKKNEKIEALKNSLYALDLIKSNEIYIKIKASAKAIANYKCADDNKVTYLLELLSKIRIGSVITRYAKLTVKRNSIKLDEKTAKRYDREVNSIEKEINGLYAMCETLNVQSIDLLKSMYSNRQSDKTVTEVYKKLAMTATNIIEKTTKSPKGAEEKKGIETIFAKAEMILKDAEKMVEETKEEVEEKVENTPESPTDAPIEEVVETTVSQEENAVEEPSGAVIGTDCEYVEIFDPNSVKNTLANVG